MNIERLSLHDKNRNGLSSLDASRLHIGKDTVGNTPIVRTTRYNIRTGNDTITKLTVFENKIIKSELQRQEGHWVPVSKKIFKGSVDFINNKFVSLIQKAFKLK